MFLSLLILPHALAADARETSVPYIPDPGIVLDGRLDEPAWQQAALITDFARWVPSVGGPPPGRTEVRVFYDKRRLYFGFLVEDPEPDRIRAHVSPREEVNADDQISVLLDPFLDRKSAYAFWINALGVQQDFRDSVTGDFNLAWDTVWWTKGVRTPTGYTVEMALPWKSLPYPRDDVQQWGVIFNRNVAREDTYFSWPSLNPTAANVIAQEGLLTDLRPPVDRLRLEAMPTLTAHQSWARDAQDGRFQAEDPWAQTVDPGLDLRYGPTPDISIEATINPDFSQIEADPFLMDVNQRYALSLTERRPFFLAGYDAFTDPLETLYTRAIVDPGWGAKVSGRLGDTHVGVLTTMDEDPLDSLVSERFTPGFSALNDPYGAQTSVLRVKQDLSDDVQVGLIFADKTRGRGQLALADPVASNAVGGADLTATFAERWLLQAEAMGSYTGADEDSPVWADYGVEPDSPDLDPAFGSRINVDLERRGSPGWTGQLQIRDVSRGFRSESSYMTRAGYTTLYTSQAYKFQPTDLSSIQPSVEGRLIFDRESGLPPERWEGVNLDLSPSQTISCWIGGGEGTELYAGQLFDGLYGWSGCSGDPAGWLTVDLELQGGDVIDYGAVELARELSASAELTLRPLPQVSLDASYAHDGVWGAEQGDLRYNLNLTRVKANVQFTRPLGLRLIGQYRDDEGLLEESALLTWLFSPGTAAYLGYSETRTRDADLGVAERSVFAKVSGLLRL